MMPPLFALTIAIAIAALVALATVAVLASCACTQMNADKFHWWCPLCHLCRFFTWRIRPEEKPFKDSWEDYQPRRS